MSGVRSITVALLLLSGVLQAADLKVGGVYGCARIPPFIFNKGLQQPFAVDTTVTRLPGLVIRELRGQQRLYQHPSWRITGHAGSTVRDHLGNIYVISVPSIGLDTNPLERRNLIYKVDAQSGLMSEFVKLPLPPDTSQNNPFGTLGLAFDCETRSLYASSVAGSSARSIKGTIYQIDIQQGDVIDSLSGIDAIGLTVFNFSRQKRLYYGDARSSSVFSLPLTASGGFIKTAKKRHEFSLLNVKNGDSTQVRKLRFKQTQDQRFLLTASATEFAYRLTAQSSATVKQYQFELSSQTQKFKFASITRNR